MNLYKTLIKGKFGGLETIVVLYPILKQYEGPGLSIGDWLLLFAGIRCYYKPNPIQECLPLRWFIIYVVIHEFVVAAVGGSAPSYMINATIDKLLPLVLIMVIAPCLDYQKVKCGFYIVGFVCMAGLLYHIVNFFLFGKTVTPITLPFMKMSAMMNEEYVDKIKIRPVSFFVEPAAYAAYMLFPLAITFIEKNLKYAMLISLFTLLSTSSNGYFQTAAMWFVFLSFDERVKRKYKILSFFLIIAIAFWVMNSELFALGINKISNTDFEDDVRVSAGYYVYMNMPFLEKILGVIAANPSDYILSHPEVMKNITISISDKNVYLPMIWFYSIKYGLIGSIFVFCCIFYGWGKRQLRPMIIAVIMSVFVQSLSLVMPMIITFLVMNRSKVGIKSQ